MKRLAIFLMAFLALTSFSATQTDGQDVEQVILASTENYPDAMISAAPANKLGIPVLLTERDQLTQSTEEALSELNPSEVTVVGGPSVVSEEVVNNQVAPEVDSVTRLWGMTQVGTSVEVADHFWSEGSDEATIVQYPQDSENGYRLLGSVKNEVQDQDEPILISKEGTLSASVLSAVERLGAEEVEVYSTGATNVTQDLRDVGVQNVEVEEGEMEELTEQVERKTTTGIENATVRSNKTLVIVAAANFRDAISAPSVPHSDSYVVGSSEQITEAVELARDTEAEKIFVTGNPDLAQQIADRIETETNRTVDRVSGENAAEVAADLTTRNQEEWRKLQDKRYSSWKDRVNSAPGIRKAANKTLQRAETEITSNSSEEARNLLQNAQQAFESGDYFRAKQYAGQALSEQNVEQFQGMAPEEVSERVEDEREDFQEASRELKKLNQEKAQELREAETMEERMEIIREFKREHRKTVRELKEEAGENREDRAERREETENSRFEQRPGDSGEVGTSSVSLETDGAELEAEARYVASTAGYTRDIAVQNSSDRVAVDFSLSSPEGPAAQMITEYRVERSMDLDNGTYTAKVTLTVDGEQMKTLERQVEIPSTSEFESETEKNESEEQETENTPEDSEDTVTYTDSGFQPEKITVEAGEEVTWVDESSSKMEVAVDRHSTHRQYDGTSRSQHCPDPENNVFDQCEPGSEYSFTFEEAGTYSYHNHRAAGDTGTVVVE